MRRRRVIGSTSALVVLAWMLLCPAMTVSAADSPASKEYQIKAAFIYNFTKFVDWPAAAFPDKTTPIAIGVLGTNPFGSELNAAVEGRHVNGREIIVRAVNTEAEISAVHVLYISPSESARAPELLRSLRSKPILTVGEKDSFSRDGGVISFLLEGDKVRFSINMDAAEAARIKVSAQLQKLAISVQRKP